jgi:hypothetical protein
MTIGFSNLIKLALLGATILLCANFIFQNVAAQKNRSRAEFSHTEKAHKQSCGSCHKVPSGNWRASGNYPNITDYPKHESCVGCHRQDFFAGNRPQICTVCHVEASPRGKARLRFPVRARSQEFTINFPHSVHQDVIALDREREGFQTAHFVNAAFETNLDDKKPQFNSCAICHHTATDLPAFTTRKLLGIDPLASPVGETFTARAEFFKNSPVSHASCFSCHYQGQKPFATDCASCHLLASPHFDSNVISRYSLKFNHEDENHNNKDCVTCHIRITQNVDLKTLLGADVPLLTCSSSSCHGDQLKAEIAKRTTSLAAKENIFQCNYCHTSAIGSYPIPISHQSIK